VFKRHSSKYPDSLVCPDTLEGLFLENDELSLTQKKFSISITQNENLIKDPITTFVKSSNGDIIFYNNTDYDSFFKSFYIHGNIISKDTNFSRFDEEPTMFTDTSLFTM